MQSRESVTILFTDLVGSTEVFSRLLTENARALRAAHFGGLGQAISAAGGRMIKNLGDGVMAVFPTATAAVDAAVGIQQRVADHNRRAGAGLAVRVGVSAGEVAPEHDDYFGDAVVEAARLCAAAQGGEILVADVVRALTRGRGARYGESRLLVLKGLPDPVAACSVAWDPDPLPGAIGLPWRMSLAPRSGVVGRDLERQVLLTAVKAFSTGEGRRVVLVGGEAGVGKTTLVADAARAAHREGISVLYGGCDEELPGPYRPFVEAFGQLVREAPDDWMAQFEPQRLAELARLVPEVTQRWPVLPPPLATDPDAERYLLFGAATAVLTRAAAIEPVLLVLDDLHWADRQTLQLLRHLVSSPLGRVMVVATYRDTELSATHPLTDTLGWLSRESGVEQLGLTGLDLGDIVALLEAVAGHSMEDEGRELARLLSDETAGNPFFLSEVLRHLVETGALVQDETGTWRTTGTLAPAGLPDSVRAVVRARAARLDEEGVTVLSFAAVAGQSFDVDVVARAMGADGDRVLDLLEGAARMALVAEERDAPGRFRFRHALVQHALYDGLGVARRRRLHHRIADAIDPVGDGGERVAELAQHLLTAGDVRDSVRVMELCRHAGVRALAAAAPDEGVRWYAEALGLADAAEGCDAAARAAILVGLGDAKRQAGDPDSRRVLLEAADVARQAGAHALVVASALANSRGFASASGTLDPDRIAVLEHALVVVGPDGGVERARLLALLAAELTYADDSERRLQLAADGRAIARGLGDRGTLLHALNASFHPSWVPDNLSERGATTEEALRLATELGDPVAAFWASLWRGFTTFEQGDPVETAHHFARVKELASEVGQPTLRWLALNMDAMWTMLLGDAERSEQIAFAALQLGTDTGQPDTTAIFGAHLLGVRWHQGRLGEVADLVADVTQSNPGIHGYRAAYAHCLLESERTEEARDRLHDEARLGFEHPDVFLRYTYLALWAEVAGQVADTTAAEVLLGLLLPYADRVAHNGTSTHGSIAHFVGLLAGVLGDLDAAESHLGQALLVHERFDAPFFAARTRLELARVLRRRGAPGDGARATVLLADAAAAAERFGCLRVARQVGAESAGDR